jgi:hypothetical protein
VKRFSVSVDEDLAEWIESQADQRGVSKAKIIRDSVETARGTGLVKSDASKQHEAGEILDRLEALETRVAALEQTPLGTTDNSSDGTEGIVSAFAEQIEDSPPRTEHGKQAVVRTFSLLLKDGPLQTGELKERLYPEFEETFSNADSMWESIRRYFEEIPGIEKTGHGEYDAVPSQVSYSE